MEMIILEIVMKEEMGIFLFLYLVTPSDSRRRIIPSVVAVSDTNENAKTDNVWYANLFLTTRVQITPMTK